MTTRDATAPRHMTPRRLGEDAIGTPPQRPTLVPAERYYSAAFAQLEVERMWPKVWQLACTVDHVAEPGDYFEYRCGPYSVLIVRGDDGTLRAFQNVCRHRGNSLCAGAGSDLRELRCGYHGWTWDLAGVAQASPEPQGIRRAADGRASVVRGPRRHLGEAGLRQSRSRRAAAGRLPRSGARRHRLAWARRLPLLRNHDRRGRRELEDDRRRVQRDVSHPDAASRAAQVHGRRLCTAGHLGTYRQVRADLRCAESAPQAAAERCRCVGRLCPHAGRADGCRRGHSVPGDQCRPDSRSRR